MSRRSSSIVGNPVLVGAITVLITVVGVFLAYNANNGLPFVPVYHLDAVVPNASGLIRGNDVMIGGSRVGTIGAIKPELAHDGRATARLELKLEKSVEPLPADTTLSIRPKSPLGLKYVELTRGRSARTLPDGATLPLSNAAAPPVEIDDFFNIFNRPTRAGARTQLDEFGTGVAGRGQALNETIATLPHLAGELSAVMRNLADPRTQFASLFPALEQAAAEVAPVGLAEGAVFRALDQTFTALAQAAPAIQASITGGPPALATATRELPAQARFVDASTDLFRRLRPAFGSLAEASVQLAPAFAAGRRSLPRAPALNRRIETTLSKIDAFAADPRTVPGLARLAETAGLLQPVIAFATPAQTVCNYYALFFRNLESALSESDAVGSFLRVGILALPQQAGSEAGPSAVPADGPAGGDFSHIPDSYLHSDPYPNTAAPGQTRECEAGNETYIPGRQVIGSEPGNQTTASEPTRRLLK